jgi:hypothetical protein
MRTLINFFLHRFAQWYEMAEDLEAAESFLLWDWLLLSH